MSRLEQDRDDLFQEIQALQPRLQLQLAGGAGCVTAGCRAATGGWSIYFDQDPAYHFDVDGRLRRAFVDGRLYRTQGTTLARLTREREAGQVTLVRHDLGPADLEAFLSQMRSRLLELRDSIRSGNAIVVRESPEGGGTIGQLAEALGTITSGALALADAIPTRRS